MSRPRVVFMGTPAFSVPALEAVAKACDVALVVTQPDRPKGRGLETAESEVAAAARSLGLEVFKPADPNAADAIEHVRETAPDLAAVVAFGSILSGGLLSVPRLGGINLHGSLLPDYRGASPVQRALWDGRTVTGVTTIWMDEGIDTGDMILQRSDAIRPEDDAGTLAARLAAIGAPLLAESLVLAHSARAPRLKQERGTWGVGAGSYAKKLRKEDGAIDWSLDAASIWNRVRAVTPWPGAATTHEERRLGVTRATPWDALPTGVTPGTIVAIENDGVRVGCGFGTLRLERVKPEGRSEMSAADWARGARLAPGAQLGATKEAVK